MRVYNYNTTYLFNFTFIEVIIAIFVLFFILLYGYLKSYNKINKEPLYKYYFGGLIAKMGGALIFALVYGLYYKGGDTIAYWFGAEALKNLFYSNPYLYFAEILSPPSIENKINHYTVDTGWPPEWVYRSTRHFFVSKVVSFFCIIIPSSFLGVTFFMGFLSYQGMWKLYETMVSHFPHLFNKLRIGILFFPSTLFWCSGIMKDSFVLLGVCWIVYETDQFLRTDIKRNYFRFFSRLIFYSWLAFSMKPYVIIALATAWLLWINYQTFKNIKNKIFKYIFTPLLLIITIVMAFRFYLTITGASEFSVDNLMDNAIITRNDFSNNITYGTNRYKVKEIGASTSEILKNIPTSITNGLFRPFIWEARSPIVFFSGVENLFLLIYTIYILFKLRIVGLLKFIKSSPLLTFSFVFILFLSYIVGFTTVVFGALVRFKTPMLPFFVSFLVIAGSSIISNKKSIS